MCAGVSECVCVCRQFPRILAYKSASSANTVYAKQKEYSSQFYNRSGLKRPEAACEVQIAGCSALVGHSANFQRGTPRVGAFLIKQRTFRLPAQCAV